MAPEQDLLSACASCPLLAPQKGIAAWMAPGVLSICKESALAHLIPLSNPYVGALCTGPAFWDHSPQWRSTQLWGKPSWLRAWRDAEVPQQEGACPQAVLS